MNQQPLEAVSSPSLVRFLKNAFTMPIILSDFDRPSGLPSTSRVPDAADKAILRCSGPFLRISLNNSLVPKIMSHYMEIIKDKAVTQEMLQVAAGYTTALSSGGAVKINGEEVLQKLLIFGPAQAINMSLTALEPDGSLKYLNISPQLTKNGSYVSPGNNNHLSNPEREQYIPPLLEERCMCSLQSTRRKTEDDFLNATEEMTEHDLRTNYPPKDMNLGEPPSVSITERTAIPDLAYTFKLDQPSTNTVAVYGSLVVIEVKLPSVLSIKDFDTFNGQFAPHKGCMDIHLVYKKSSCKRELRETAVKKNIRSGGQSEIVEQEEVSNEEAGDGQDVPANVQVEGTDKKEKGGELQGQKGKMSARSYLVKDGKQCWEELTRKGQKKIYYMEDKWISSFASRMSALWQHILVQVHSSMSTAKTRYALISTGEMGMIVDSVGPNVLEVSEPIKHLPTWMCSTGKGLRYRPSQRSSGPPQDDVISVAEIMKAIAVYSLREGRIPSHDYPRPPVPHGPYLKTTVDTTSPPTPSPPSPLRSGSNIEAGPSTLEVPAKRKIEDWDSAAEDSTVTSHRSRRDRSSTSQ